MKETCGIEIDAPADVVWRVFADVERWSEWTKSVTSVRALDESALAVGRRYEIRQPRFPRLVWEVTDVEDGVGWTWRQRSPGGTTFARHHVAELPDGRTLVRQEIEQRGPIGALVGRLTRGLTRRYLDMEAQGLKRRSEQVAGDAPAG